MRKEKYDIYTQKHPSRCYSEHTPESLSFLTKLIPPHKYSNLLDIGCGEGTETYALHKLGYNVVGITQGETNLQYAKTHYKDLDIRIMDMCDLEFESNTFNAIYMNHSFEHSLAPFIQLVEMYIVLTNNPLGRIFINLPHYKEPEDPTNNPDINNLNHHHPNMLSPSLFKQLFSICFNILYDTTNLINLKNNTNSIYFDHAYLLEKKPLNQLHSDVRTMIKERIKKFG